MVVGVVGELLLIVRFAVLLPVLVGRNRILIVHVALAASGAAP